MSVSGGIGTELAPMTPMEEARERVWTPESEPWSRAWRTELRDRNDVVRDAWQQCRQDEAAMSAGVFLLGPEVAASGLHDLADRLRDLAAVAEAWSRKVDQAAFDLEGDGPF